LQTCSFVGDSILKLGVRKEKLATDDTDKVLRTSFEIDAGFQLTRASLNQSPDCTLVFKDLAALQREGIATVTLL